MSALVDERGNIVAPDWHPTDARNGSDGVFFDIVASVRGCLDKTADRMRVATTLGYGPRFLHSTGQFHKGGPDTGLFLQLVDKPVSDLDVPETDYSFGRVIAAQPLADYQALVARGRRVLCVQLGGNPESGLASVAKAPDA